MRNTTTQNIIEAAGYGVLAGMRSMLTPAFFCYSLQKQPDHRLKGCGLNILQSPVTANVFKVAALGELLGDKHPKAPNRTDKPAMVFRALSGALGGAVVFKKERKQAIVGALLGGVAAVAATYGCFYLRKKFRDMGIVPDVVLGLIEDAVAIGIGITLVK